MTGNVAGIEFSVPRCSNSGRGVTIMSIGDMLDFVNLLIAPLYTMEYNLSYSKRDQRGRCFGQERRWLFTKGTLSSSIRKSHYGPKAKSGSLLFNIRYIVVSTFVVRPKSKEKNKEKMCCRSKTSKTRVIRWFGSVYSINGRVYVP